MELDESGYYRMPLLLGPLWRGSAPRWRYTQTEIVALQYLTDPTAIAPLLPNCYQPGAKPLVTVFYAYHSGLEFMAGGGYNMATVQVAARFDGERDHLEGDYILVMFEDQTWPIIGGREDLGVPKLYADIPPLKIAADGSLRCEASLWGHLLFRLELIKPRRQNRVVKLAATRLVNARPWLAYKYIPSLDGPPDADYPTITKNDTRIDELWFAKTGSVDFGQAGIADVGQVKYLMDALQTLPIRKVERALRLRGSALLRYDLSRRLG